MRLSRILCVSALCVSAVSAGVPVAAQTVSPSDLPSGADVGRAPEPVLPQADKFSGVDSQARQVPVARAPQLPADLAGKVFRLKALRIQGMSAFSAREVEKLYGGDIGKEITVSRLFDILTALQTLYFDAGYTLTRVYLPTQDVESGVVTFQVTEGYVADVEIDPALRRTAIVEAFRRDVLAMRPLNVLRLERLLLLLNDRPGLSVSSVLSALPSGAGQKGGAEDGAVSSGAVRLLLKKNDEGRRPVGFVSGNDYGSRYSGPWQVLAGLTLDEGLPNYGNALAYLTETASARELRQGKLVYTTPLAGASGLTATFSAGKTRTAPGYSLEPLRIRGDSVNAVVGLKYPLIRQRDRSFYIGTEFSYKNAYTDILMEPLFRDRIRTVSWSADYYFADRWQGVNLLGVKVGQGLNILGARSDSAQDTSRAEGKSCFTKMEMTASRFQPLAGDYALTGELHAQYADEALLSPEEFGFGGASLGRGYDESEISGDRGVSATLELKRSNIFGAPFRTSELYGFYDFGQVWNIDPSAKGTESAVSTGVGFRGRFANGLDFEAALAFPLTKPVETEPAYSSKTGPRLLFSVRYTF